MKWKKIFEFTGKIHFNDIPTYSPPMHFFVFLHDYKGFDWGLDDNQQGIADRVISAPNLGSKWRLFKKARFSSDLKKLGLLG